MAEGVVIVAILFGLFGFVAWITFTTIRRYKAAKLQAGVQTKLLEKFGSGQELGPRCVNVREMEPEYRSMNQAIFPCSGFGCRAQFCATPELARVSHGNSQPLKCAETQSIARGSEFL